MAPSTTKTDEPKLTLPVGHPQAGYTTADLSYHEGTGTLPDEEIEVHEERNAAREEEVEAVAENEHKVATAEIAERAGDAKDETSTRSSAASAPAAKASS